MLGVKDKGFSKSATEQADRMVNVRKNCVSVMLLYTVVLDHVKSALGH